MTTKAEYKKYRLYGIIGMVGLFLVGVIVGLGLHTNTIIKNSVMNESQCRTIYRRMDDAIKYSNYDSFEKLSKMFAANCSTYNFDNNTENVVQESVSENKMPETTCGKIEMLLTERLYDLGNPNAEAHIDNAKVYANLSERGCSENSEKYKMLAKQELEIARALNDDNLNYQDESVEIVETYKRLQMQQEAERMIEKAKKLTNPAIDFIIQLEKIIEED